MDETHRACLSNLSENRGRCFGHRARGRPAEWSICLQLLKESRVTASSLRSRTSRLPALSRCSCRHRRFPRCQDEIGAPHLPRSKLGLLLAFALLFRCELPDLIRLLKRAIPVGRIPYCTSIVGFGICYFLHASGIATLVPASIPWHMFWTYFAGSRLLAALALLGMLSRRGALSESGSINSSDDTANSTDSHDRSGRTHIHLISGSQMRQCQKANPHAVSD
jgi:hypothetical protein